MTDARFLGFSDCIEVKYCGELDSSEHISSEERVAVRTDKHQARLTTQQNLGFFHGTIELTPACIPPVVTCGISVAAIRLEYTRTC